MARKGIKHLIVYDFETYYDSKSYTLSKMSAIDYVRDPKFYAQLLAVSVDGKEPICVEHDDIPNVLNAMKLDNPNHILVGHNSAGFDNLILSEVYGIKPKCILTDTMHLARWSGLSRICGESLKAMTDCLGLGTKGTGTITSDGKRTKQDFTQEEWASFIEYCKQDVRLTVKLATKLLAYVTSDAIKFSSITSKMATEPMFVINLPPLREYLKQLEDKEKEAQASLKTIFNLSDEDFMTHIRSAKKFQAMLELLNVDVPMKLSEKRTATAQKKLEKDLECTTGQTRKEIEEKLSNPASYEVYVPALSKQDLPFLALQDHPDPHVRELVRLRLEHNSSVPMSRTKALIHMGEYEKPVPILLKCYYAHTSRYGAGTTEGKSDSLNFQNMAKHNKNMKPIRQSITAPEGYAVVACDSSQIEARVNAYMSNEKRLLEQFAEHRDPYAEQAALFGTGHTAQQIHDGAKSGDAELKKLRNVAKKLILSCQYGTSAAKLSTTLLRDGVRLADDDAEHTRIATSYHTMYRQTNANIVWFWKTCRMALVGLIAKTPGTFGGPNNNLFKFDYMAMPNGTTVPSISLPTGYILRYPNLRLSEEEGTAFVYDKKLGREMVPVRTYGAAITENCCQALSFQILMYQALLMQEAGITIHCNIHDSFATVVPESKAEETKEIMLECMRTVPSWVEGLPLDAEAEIGKDFTIC